MCNWTLFKTNHMHVSNGKIVHWINFNEILIWWLIVFLLNDTSSFSFKHLIFTWFFKSFSIASKRFLKERFCSASLDLKFRARVNTFLGSKKSKEKEDVIFRAYNRFYHALIPLYCKALINCKMFLLINIRNILPLSH